MFRLRAAAAALLLACAGAAPSQETHGVSPADLERGAQIFLNNCAGCHGPDGDLITGINFAAGQYRSARGDNELRRIVQKGLPGTPMPPGNYSDEQAGVIVAYLRAMATSGSVRRSGPAGDAARGKGIVEGKGQCLNCHRVGPLGTVTGPDLTSIGSMRRGVDLERSLLDPDAEIRPDNLTVRAVAKDGTKITGRLMNMDTYRLQILDSSAKLRSLEKDQLREWEVLQKSPMPGYKDKLSAQEVSDVVSYLVSLKEAR